ncbi:MAG: hypothetical protein KatS3mg110_4064 [Pirellulaceae bacterium]|nr:MAG: hypothetical protein KatS3mg110_4064 [Pirellulaceae bacterium]
MWLLSGSRNRWLIVCGLVLIFAGALLCVRLVRGSRPRLAVDQPVVHLGVLRADQQRFVRYRFPFEVEGKEALRITRIVTSCNCLSSDTSVTDRILPPGYRGEIEIRADLYERVGAWQAECVVETEPPCSPPVVLRLSAVVIQPPEPIPARLEIEAVEGSLPEFPLVVRWLREASWKPLALDLERSQFGGLDFLYVEQRSEPRGPLGPSERLEMDVLRIGLKSSRRFPSGIHPFEVQLAWENDLSKTTVPIQLRIVPGVALTPAHLFAGELLPGELCELETRLQIYDRQQQAEVVGLECDLSFAETSYVKDGHRIVIHLVAPNSVGRFQGTVCVRLGGARPPLCCTVSGVVVEKKGHGGESVVPSAGLP